MNHINELNLDDQLKRGATRRTVVTTGVKLAYAVPLVAATVGLTASGALAVCGGTTPLPFESGGLDLCCGCCPQGLAARSTSAVITDPITEALQTCQKILAEQGTECPLAGQPGDDENRVCIAPDAKLT